MISAQDAFGANNELLAMPYACRVERGEVGMQRSDERLYRVIGPRDQQTLRICAAHFPERCRTLEIFRFTFDCDGVRIPWIEAAEATAPVKPWRQRVADGRMTLRFWAGGPVADRQSPVTLPAGFAPAPLSGVRFVAAVGDASAAAERSQASLPLPPLTVPRPVLSARGNMGGPDSRDGGSPLLKSGDDLAPVRRWAEPSALDRLERPQPSLMGLGWTATVALANDTARSGRWFLLERGGNSNTLLAILGLAAVLLSATAVAARHRRVVKSPAQIGDHGIDGDFTARASALASASAAPPPPPPLPRAARQIELDEAPTQLAPPSAQPPPVPSQPQSDWDAVAELGATAAALLEIVQQMIASDVPEGRLREVLDSELVVTAARLNGPEISLALEDGRFDLVHPVYTQAILDLERVRVLAQIEHERLLETSGELPRSPSTFEEACEFLGVNPRASEAVVKKVVDALRQNWHPDLADDDIDRVVREERIKRINMAWDLIRVR